MKIRVALRDISIEVDDNKIATYNSDVIKLITAMTQEVILIAKSNEDTN